MLYKIQANFYKTGYLHKLEFYTALHLVIELLVQKGKGAFTISQYLLQSPRGTPTLDLVILLIDTYSIHQFQHSLM